MKQVSISEFKSHLSKYIKAASTGERILVADHGRPVAELTAPNEVGLRFRPASEPPESALHIRTVKLRAGVSAQAVLRELREDR